MIGQSLGAARTMLEDLVALRPCTGAGPEVEALCAEVTSSVTAETFPGALVPVIDRTGVMQIDVATSTIAAWRSLKPVLMAFAGPTLTGFNGLPETFDPSDAVGARLLQVGPIVTAIMRLPADERSRIIALRAVLRARHTLERAPDLRRSAPVPTSWLLTQFQDYLNVERRTAAVGVLDRLRSELRLDALNIKFLELQLLATFEDWAAIIALPEFASLCVARKTPATTAIILEALYRCYLAVPFETNDRVTTRSAFETFVRPFVQVMPLTFVPPGLSEGGWRLIGLEVLVDPGRRDLLASLAHQSQILGWIADLLPTETPTAPSLPPVAEPLDMAREALLHVAAADSIDLLADALTALGRLSPDELALLREAMPFRPIVQESEESAGIPLPTSWIAWLDRLGDPTFFNALDVARHGKDEWEITVSTGDPIAVHSLVSALERVQSDSVAAERTTQALPYFVAWVQRDAEFPRAALAPIYSELLTLFALSSARGATIYESSHVLVEALLATGLDQKAYRDLIADVEEIAGDGFGVDMVYWVLAIVESFMNATSPDASARESFLHRILARIAPIYGRLSCLQRTAVTQLSRELGWSLPEPRPGESAPLNDSLARRLDGLRIAIYSLTESSSRQAKAALEEIASTVMVETNADHAGTARLRALAENCDLFVMTWLSAKHAATDFIRMHRGNRPVIYSKGRGFSSVLRAIEDFLVP